MAIHSLPWQPHDELFLANNLQAIDAKLAKLVVRLFNC